MYIYLLIHMQEAHIIPLSPEAHTKEPTMT